MLKACPRALAPGLKPPTMEQQHSALNRSEVAVGYCAGQRSTVNSLRRCNKMLCNDSRASPSMLHVLSMPSFIMIANV